MLLLESNKESNRKETQNMKNRRFKPRFKQNVKIGGDGGNGGNGGSVR
jgi:hypothetical protein